jgi:UDP-N-acetylglucosamine 2-epimerase (non-hydrolysing)
MLICNVVGARPNFMKIAPIVHELKRQNIPQMLVHTGQHYDTNMSRVFFQQLELPQPEIYLGIGSDSHARQTARIMMAFEKVCQKYQPNLVVVGGDVNSTLAVALVAAKLHIPVAHVEAGLRSFDRSMPEEINRVITDHLSKLLFTTEESANENLLQEGLDKKKIHFVGNCMVDTLLHHVDVATEQKPWENFGLKKSQYALLTLHRPSNVDNAETLYAVINIINQVSRRLPILFPIHPRTQKNLIKWNVTLTSSIKTCKPLPYLTFLGLMAGASAVLTDSGGIQEETTVLQVPCLTMRLNTERPVTISQGTNKLVGCDPKEISEAIDAILNGNWPSGTVPPLWDGRASKRIVEIIEADLMRHNYP